MMGLFDSLFKPDTTATTAAYNQQQDYIQGGAKKATKQLKAGLNQSAAPLNQAGDIYGQFGQQFQPGVDMYLNSLGLNGPEGNAAATGAFQAGPGYQWQVDQSLQAALRNNAAMGNVASGNALIELQNRGNQLANQEYGNWQNRLSGLINPSFQGISGQAQTLQDLSNLFEGNYNNRANVSLGAASNMANAAGQYGQNMQSAANAETAGWSSLLSGLLGAGAKLGGAYLG